MDRDSINFVRSALPEGRTVFREFPDRYAFMILAKVVGESGRRISELKNSRYGALLRKPSIKTYLSCFGDGLVRAPDLRAVWPNPSEAFRLTLGTWPDLDEKPSPRWSQVTRWGWNLVLQLNLKVSHVRGLAERVPRWQRMVEHPHHPIASDGELTLAWARIDLDLETREALIEEIQSDWVRDAKWMAQRESADEEDWVGYVDGLLKPYTKRWPECILTAAIWFLTEEIGIDTLFYHTHETGKKLKHISGTAPPRSLYTDLPRKFCFEVTHNGPLFVRDTARRDLKESFTDPDTQWHVLDFEL